MAPIPCGSAALFCPSESPSVSVATSGYYTTPDTDDATSVRESQQPCEAGFACVGGKKTKCKLGKTYQEDATKSSCLTCSTCPSGTFKTSGCTTTSNTVCEPCPAGSACLDETKISCSSRLRYQPEGSKSSCRTCSACSPGYYQISDCTTISDRVCGPCPRGASCINGHRTGCIERQTFQLDPARPSCRTCKTCPPGHHETAGCTTTSNTECEECSPGSACVEGGEIASGESPTPP